MYTLRGTSHRRFFITLNWLLTCTCYESNIRVASGLPTFTDTKYLQRSVKYEFELLENNSNRNKLFFSETEIFSAIQLQEESKFHIPCPMFKLLRHYLPEVEDGLTHCYTFIDIEFLCVAKANNQVPPLTSSEGRGSYHSAMSFSYYCDGRRHVSLLHRSITDLKGEQVWSDTGSKCRHSSMISLCIVSSTSVIAVKCNYTSVFHLVLKL